MKLEVTSSFFYVRTENDISIFLYMPNTYDVNVLSSFTQISSIAPSIGVKLGISTVFAYEDEDDERIEFYGHAGAVYGYSGTSKSLSISIGIISNYSGEGSYDQHFISTGAGFFIGIDHSFDPTRSHDKTIKSTSLTFGCGLNAYTGYDYYYYFEKLTIRMGWLDDIWLWEIQNQFVMDTINGIINMLYYSMVIYSIHNSR